MFGNQDRLLGYVNSKRILVAWCLRLVTNSTFIILTSIKCHLFWGGAISLSGRDHFRPKADINPINRLTF
jgi:hypothetical protein